ncbi:porin [Salmonella enterica]|nr:hypothetical protein [Salmonella enterica]EDX9156397.1 hypothetical protein [Salmonella enterica subsp. enterica serovar Sandiego]EIC7818884.1 porin [Salmonella enterica]EJH6881043.1 porin [Salmonella enterica]EJO3888225.1 porin [Salmonella enterica]
MMLQFSRYCLVAFSLLFSPGVLAVNLVNRDGKNLDFYGTIIARHFTSNNVKDDGDRSYLYFGLIGRKDFATRWQAYAHWEYTVSASDASRNATRLAFLGIDNPDWGSLDTGRNWGVLYDVTSLTDRSPLFREMSYNYIDNFMRGRALNLMTWRKGFSLFQCPLKVALQYQFKGNNDSRTLKQQNGNGAGASLVWYFTPELSGLFSASSSATTYLQQNAGYQKNIRTFAEGLNYNSRKWYLAAVLTQSNNAIHLQARDNSTSSISYEVLMKYMLTDKFQPVVSYTRLTQTVAGRRTQILDYEELGFSYYFNKNMQVFVDYKFNNARNGSSGVDCSDKLETGISYHW